MRRPHGRHQRPLSVHASLLLGTTFLATISNSTSLRWNDYGRSLSASSLQEEENDGEDSSFTTQVTFDEILRVLIFVISVHYAGEVVTIVRMPALVGQIFAGIVLGPQVTAFVPHAASLVLLGEVGLILLMFEAGIEVDIALLRTSGMRAIIMSMLCAAAATASGIGMSFVAAAANLTNVDFQGAFSVGATFAQTAIGTCMPVLQDGGLMREPIGQMILAATMVDDMIALTLLSVMESFASPEGEGETAQPPVIYYFVPLLSSVALLVGFGSLAFFVAPRAMDDFLLPNVKSKHHSFVLYLLMTGITLAYMPLFKAAKSSYLMGASLAGMTFSQCKKARKAFSKCQTIYHWLMKFFFAASIGFQIPVHLFGQGRVWMIASLFIVTAVPFKAVALIFVPKFQEADAFFNVHRRDQLVAALSMMSRGGFGFLISAYAFNAYLIDAQLYASVVLAILIATIFPSYLLNYVVIKYGKLKQKVQNNRESLSEKCNDGKMPLYFQINIETKAVWGLVEKMLREISSIGLKVEDFKSKPVIVANPTIRNTFFLREDKTRVKIRYKAPSISEMGDERSIIENRFRQINEILEVKLKSFQPLIEISPWSPFESMVFFETLQLLTRDNGEEYSFDFFTCLFAILDRNGDLELTIEELAEGLKASGFDLSKNDLRVLIENMDTSHNGRISSDEWNETMSYFTRRKRETLRVSSIDQQALSEIFATARSQIPGDFSENS